MTIKELHRKAMNLTQDAIVASEIGNDVQAIELYKDAYGFEAQAAMILKDQIDNEPTRSIIIRSAANLALECGLVREAEKLVTLGLSGNPKDREAEELRNLYENINLARHLKINDIDLKLSELQMSLSGNEVGYGLVNSDEFIDRFKKFETLTIRTAERKSGKEFRTSGRPSAVIRNIFQPYLSVPRAASFAVTVRVGKSNNVQLDVFEGNKVEEVINEVVLGLKLVDEKAFDELNELINNKVYYDNFLSLAKEIAPDGDKIKQVGFTFNYKGGEISVGMTSTKSEIQIKPIESNIDSEIEIYELSGTLRIADGTRNKITIVSGTNDKVSHTIKVPDGLNDIVRDYWDEEVTAVLQRKGNKSFLLEISIQEK